MQDDGTLVCIWGDPAADTTRLTTTIQVMSRGPALELLNGLADEHGFTCYTPDGGTRCEKTWQNADYPVTDGRTVFWRDDILIDTTFSNLAPSGYTAAIVEQRLRVTGAGRARPHAESARRPYPGPELQTFASRRAP